MSTHCGIAVKTEKGYTTIYCHFDGYLEYMWPMLNNNYNSSELAHKLISQGDASSISEKLSPTTDSHSFDHPEEGVSVFYYRDRGEAWSDVSPNVYTKNNLLNTFYYVYIFEEGSWNAYKNGRKVD